MGTFGLPFLHVSGGWIHEDYLVHHLAIESSSSHQDTHYGDLTCSVNDTADSFVDHLGCNSVAAHN